MKNFDHSDSLLVMQIKKMYFLNNSSEFVTVMDRAKCNSQNIIKFTCLQIFFSCFVEMLAFKNYLESLLSGAVEVCVITADIQHQIMERVGHGIDCVNWGNISIVEVDSRARYVLFSYQHIYLKTDTFQFYKAGR